MHDLYADDIGDIAGDIDCFNGRAFDFVEDNPGKWLYHCHVVDHMMGGMVGWYQVDA